MSKPVYIVEFMTTNGVWMEMPECDSPEVVGELVAILMRVTKVVGEAVKVRKIDRLTVQ